MLSIPLSEISLSNTETDYFKRALVGQKEKDAVTCNRRALLAMMAYLSDDIEFLNFIEAFAGRTIKVPSKQHVIFLCHNAKIYNYYCNHGAEDTLSHFEIDQQKLDRILIYAS